MLFDTDAIIKWFEVAFLTLFGGFLWWYGPKLFSASGLIPCVTLPCSDRARITDAIARREAVESLPNAGPVFGIAGLVLAAGVALNAISAQMSYALFVLVIATALVWLYTHVRRPAYARRAAVLAPRALFAAPPAYYVAGLAAIACLPVGREGRITASDAIVILAVVAMIAFAFLVGRLPAMLTGDDGDAELYVDQRLRRKRTLSMLYYACATAFVYETWELLHVHTAASDIARLVVMVVWIVVFFGTIRESRKIVGLH